MSTAIAAQGRVLDLTRDLKELTRLAGEPRRVDDLLERALDTLRDVIPYDLAAVLELEGEELAVRCARGPLCDDRVRRHRVQLASFPDLRRALETRRARTLDEHDHGHGADPYHGLLDLPHGHSCMVVPLFAGERTLGALTFDRTRCERYDAPLVDLATIYGQIIALALTAAEYAASLERNSRQLAEQNRLLEGEVTGERDAGELLALSQNPAMKRLAELARQVAATDAPVLITGETGVGKEVLARAIHGWSRRRARPFVKLNCAALPENLIESELFGHRKGAFSGATETRPGRFAVANGGTLLLDEIGDLPLGAQAKLLRVLQEGEFEPVGSDRTVKVDVRILAATHLDLERALADGRFRQDLYYRLDVFPLCVPPLRERKEDLLSIAAEILRGIARRTGRGPWRLSAKNLERLRAYPWPGNVRELVNCLERATILSSTQELVLDLPHDAVTREASGGAALGTLAEHERAYLERVLDHTGGKLYGKGGAAEILGLKPSTLQSRMQKLGVSRARRAPTR
ncbi:MAG: sigma 54-interacting transcriptional regulator [Planctomycetes bacterium]|nr:sigma 54-interacting transcriptional regulator [Planctomycetota bacterium]